MEKFRFDRDFLSEDPKHARQNAERRETRTAKVREAEAEGYAAGVRDAVAEAERRAAVALEGIAASVHHILSTVNLELDEIRDDTTRLGSHIARRFVSSLVKEMPGDFIETAISTCLDVARREPKIVVEVPADLASSIGERMKSSISDHGLEGRVILSETGATNISCRLDWQSGGALISLEETLAEIDRAVENQIQAIRLAREADSSERTRTVA